MPVELSGPRVALTAAVRTADGVPDAREDVYDEHQLHPEGTHARQHHVRVELAPLVAVVEQEAERAQQPAEPQHGGQPVAPPGGRHEKREQLERHVRGHVEREAARVVDVVTDYEARRGDQVTVTVVVTDAEHQQDLRETGHALVEMGHARGVSGDGSHVRGDSRQETGDMRQETGDR